jgi:hypothetical protein
MPSYFRITVEDLETGDKQVMEVSAGDYVVIPFAPCYRDGVQSYPLEGRHVITVKGHSPSGPARAVEPAAPPAEEFTWRHNRFIGVRDATRDRAEAERAAERCRTANPGDDIGVVARSVTDWQEV